MNKQISALYGSFAAGLETAAAAARQLEAMQDEDSTPTTATAEVHTNGATNGATNGKAAEETTVKPAKAAKAAKPAKAAAPAITFEVLKAKLTELVNTKGKEAAKEILSTFGAPKLVDLDEENYADAHAAALAAMAEADEPPAAEDEDMFGD